MGEQAWGAKARAAAAPALRMGSGHRLPVRAHATFSWHPWVTAPWKNTPFAREHPVTVAQAAAGRRSVGRGGARPRNQHRHRHRHRHRQGKGGGAGTLEPPDVLRDLVEKWRGLLSFCFSFVILLFYPCWGSV